MTNEIDHTIPRQPPESLSIDLTLTHPSFDPKRVTELLSIEPTFSWKKGDRPGGMLKQSTRWQGRLVSSDTSDEFDEILRNVVSLLKKNQPFWEDFAHGGGEIELILNQYIDPMEGRVLELHLYPALLGEIAHLGIGLRVQGWIRVSSRDDTHAIIEPRA